MADNVIFNFMRTLAVREGAWVIEPARAELDNDFFLGNLLKRLRNIPARIEGPDPKRPYRFAERGETGQWMMIWVPDNE